MVSTFEQQGPVLHVRLEGDLIGGADALTFNKSFRDALQTTDQLRQVVVNVRDVNFVNSSGLGMLLAARQSVAEAGATLRLDEPGDQLKSLLEITKLTEILGAGPAGSGGSLATV